MTGEIFRTANPLNDGNLVVRQDEANKLSFIIDAGSSQHAIILHDHQAAAFIAVIAALADKADGIPPHEVSTCGNAYLASERALRVIEHATKLGEAMSADAIELVHNLAAEAGAACNRLALKRDAFGDDIPF